MNEQQFRKLVKRKKLELKLEKRIKRKKPIETLNGFNFRLHLCLQMPKQTKWCNKLKHPSLEPLWIGFH